MGREAGSGSMLYLEGLHMTEREVQEVHNLLRQYEVLEQVQGLVFADNGFTDDLINLFLQIIFSVPYMKRLDLRRNAFSHDAVKKLQTHCQNIQGVTSVIWTKEQTLAINSGNQLRLTIDLAEHGAAQTRPDVDDFLVSDFSVDAADSHLQSKAGGVQAPVPVCLGGPGELSALGKGSSHAASDSTLPKIKGQPRQKGGRPSKGNKAAAKAPVVMEERHPDPKVVDKWQAGNFPKQQIAVPQEKQTRPGSGSKAAKGGGVRRAG